MSFPYYSDLLLGSEQSSADSLGRISFGSSNGGGGSNGGNKTNSFLVSTLIYGFCKYQPSPNEEEINNRYILELDPFEVGSRQCSVILQVSLYDETGNVRVPKSVLDSLSFSFMAYNDSSDSNKFKIRCTIKQGESTVIEAPIYRGRRDEWYTLSSRVLINNTYYVITIYGVSVYRNSDGSVEYTVLESISIDTELGYSKKNYNYVTNIHLKNPSLEIEDPTKEEEIRNWWNSKPTFSTEPYPLTEMGGSLLEVNPSLPEGIEVDSNFIFNSLEARINLVDDSDGHVHATIVGEIEYDNSSEGVLPLSLPVYMMAPTW